MRRVNEFIKNHPLLTLILLATVVLTVLLIVVSIKRIHSGALRIVVAPTSANIVINGQEYENGLYENIRIGKARVEIEADGFNPEEFDININSDSITNIYICLKSNNTDLLNNDDYIEACNLVNEYYGEQEKEVFWQKYPISDDIPIVVEEYSPDYTSYVYYRIDLGKYEECEQEYCLKITDLSGGNYDKAIANIREKGYNPNDYQILYEDSSKKGHAN